jgi:hypothetical protein
MPLASGIGCNQRLTSLITVESETKSSLVIALIHASASTLS